MRPQNAALLLILFLAFALRVWGLSFGLPQVTHQDELIVVHHALAYSSGDFNPHFFKIPPLLSYLLFGLYGALYGIFFLIKNLSLQEYALLFFQDPTVFYLGGRLVFGALAGTLSVFILYRIAKKLFGEIPGLLGAFFLSVSFLHVRDSHYIYVDIPMILAMLLSLDALLGYAQHKKNRFRIFACAWAGAAMAFKYIAAPVLLPILWVEWKNLSRSPRGLVKRFFEVFVYTGIVYLLLNPYNLLDGATFFREILDQAAAEARMPWLHHWAYSLCEGQGFIMAFLGLLGAMLLWVKDSSKRWFLLFPVSYYLMITFFSQPYERYAMPILPFLCLFAGYAITEGLRRFSGFWSFAGMLVVAFFVSFPTLSKSVYLDNLLGHPDTRQTAKEWILKNIPQGSSVALEHSFFSPALWQTKEQLLQKKEIINAAGGHDQAKRKRMDLVIKAAEGRPNYRVYYLEEEKGARNPFTMRSPMLERERDALRREGIEYLVRYRHPWEKTGEEAWALDYRLTASFSPYKDASKMMTEDEWANVSLPFRSRELYSRKSQGPFLEIYERKHP